MSVLKKVPAITEKKFMGQIIQLAELRGWSYFHPFDSRHSVSGWPDLVLCRPPMMRGGFRQSVGRLLFAELKRSRRHKPTLEQRDWLDRLRECGQESYLWTPEDWPEIERVLL